MRLYDCDQSEQTLVDSGQDEEYNDEETKPKRSKFAFFEFLMTINFSRYEEFVDGLLRQTALRISLLP